MVCYSVEVGEAAKPGHGRARRSTLSPNELLSIPEPGVTTLYDVVQRSVRQYPNDPAVGWRDIVKLHDVNKEVTKTVGGKEVTETKTWTYYELSEYKYWTYSEFADHMNWAAAGLRHLGLSRKTHFNIFATTSPRWLMMALACAANSIAFCTAYDSLGEEGLKHSLNEPEVVGIYTNADLLKVVAGALPDTPTVKVVIYDGQLSEKQKDLPDQIKAKREDIKVVSLDELWELGKANPDEALDRPQPSDTACIMYTSGSTGTPKGVVLSHANIVSASMFIFFAVQSMNVSDCADQVAGSSCLLADFVKRGESYLAYLPLAHVLEFVVENLMFAVGITIGYGNVKTLTDTSVKNCVGDLKAFRPTILCGVPAVWELIRKGITTKVKAGGAVKSRIFNAAMAAKKASPSILGPITDAVVFKAVREATGGRLKYALSGGAMISKDTQEFLQNCLTCIIQGYGMTESCGEVSLKEHIAILPPSYPRLESVGIPVPSIEVKLIDVPEANYFASSTPSQGEIWVRGNSVTSGYYKRDDLNKETFTEDGWMMTGDIGQWNADGTLSVIDRKKNLIKLSGGEYIALERLESIYKSCSIVSNVMVHGDSSAAKPMAVIFPHEANLRKLANKTNEDFEELCNDKEVNEAVLKELNNTARKAGCKGLETLQSVVLTSNEWTPANGLVTAAQKLQRKSILQHYKESIDKVYP